MSSVEFETLERQTTVGSQWNSITQWYPPEGLIYTSGAVQFGQLAVTPKATAPQWLVPALRALRRLAELPTNWDGYGSPPLNRAALQAAYRLMRTLENLQLPVPQVCPVTGGGISFTWQLDNRELEIEILPDSSAQYLAVVTDPASGCEEMQEEPLPLDPPRYGQTLAAWLIGG